MSPLSKLLVLSLAVLALTGCTKGSLEDPIQLPLEEVAKLNGTAQATATGTFVVSLYNGSEWDIVDVIVKISRKSESDSRVFRLSTWSQQTEHSGAGRTILNGRKKVSGETFSTTEFTAITGDFLAASKKITDPESRKELEDAGLDPNNYSNLTPTPRTDWSWSIEFVYGFRK